MGVLGAQCGHKWNEKLAQCLELPKAFLCTHCVQFRGCRYVTGGRRGVMQECQLASSFPGENDCRLRYD